MQINRIQSYGSSYLNNMSVVNNNKTQTSPSFGLKVKVPVDIPDNIKTLDALKDYLNGKNMLGLLSVVAATLGIKEGIKKTEETAVFSEPKQVETKTKNIPPLTPEQQKQFEALFHYIGTGYRKDEETGLYIIDEYKYLNKELNRYRISPDALFKYIKEVEGNADFSGSPITSLGNLEKIGGNANFENSPITDLGNLEKIGGNANFRHSLITSLGNLEKIGGDAIFGWSEIAGLGKLKEIGGDANFRYTPITSLGNLEKIGRNAEFENSQITSLVNLKEIGGNANFKNSPITSLGNLEKIDGYIYYTPQSMVEKLFRANGFII